MIVAIRVQPSQQGSEDEYVRLADMATMSEICAELTAIARHYTKVRDQHHRATAWSSCGKMMATVGVSPNALPFDQQEGVREADLSGWVGRLPPGTRVVKNGTR